MGSELCEQCAAACCQYVALEIDKPTGSNDFDDIRWYVMHKGMNVFLEDGSWYLQIRGACKNLLPDNRCGIYETRPKICRDYEAGDCDYSDSEPDYEVHFTHATQVEEYYFKKTGKKLGISAPNVAPKKRGSVKAKCKRKAD